MKLIDSQTGAEVTVARGDEIVIFEGIGACAVFFSEVSGVQDYLRALRAGGYAQTGDPERLAGCVEGSQNGGPSYKWRVPVMGPVPADRTICVVEIQCESGWDTIEMHSTSVGNHLHVLWASVCGTVAIQLTGTTPHADLLIIMGGWKETGAWSGTWPDYDDNEPPDAELTARFQAAVTEVRRKVGYVPPLVAT